MKIVMTLVACFLVQTGAARGTEPRPTMATTIDRGVATGELTTHEAAQLRQREAFIGLAHALLATDGRLDPEDKRRLRAMRVAANRTLWRLTHNRRRDPRRLVASTDTRHP